MSITFVASGAPSAASCVPGDACCRAIFDSAVWKLRQVVGTSKLVWVFLAIDRMQLLGSPTAENTGFAW